MRGKTAAVSSSSDGVQWGTTGFVAFPRSNVVLIADPRALQVVQHLHGHRYPITQVRWEELAEPLTQRMPRLLTGDDRGVVYVWNVEEHESKMFPAPFLKGSKGYSVLDLAWLPNKVHDEPPQFLVLYANHMLVGFNTAGRQLWTHDYSSYAPLQFALNPYNSSQAVMALPDSCVLIVDDISASSPPRAKPTDLHVQPRGDTGGLRHLSFNRHEEHQVVLAFAHQLVVLDLLVHRPVATVHLDRSSSAFRSVASCPHSPVLYCLHDNHSISIRSRLDQASMTYSFTGQSEALRLKTDTLLGIAVNPLNERQLCTATDAGALLLFNRGTDVDEPEPLLSAVPDITPIKALQPLFLSAQIPANSHPTCTAAAYADASGVAPFLAVGTKMGAVQLLETQPVHMSRQFTVCNNAIASVAWLGHHTLVALSSTDSATKHYHNILSLIHLPRGRVVRILDKHQKHKGRRVVPSSRGQYFLVTFETKPPELWSAKSGALITTLSTKLPPVADVSWSVSVSRLRQLQSPDDASSSHSQESRKDSDEQSFSNDATNDSSSSGVSSDGGGVYKEQFTYLGQDGTLCFFVVDHGHVECTRRITLDGTVAAFTAVVWKANVVVLTDASGGVYFWNSKDRRHNTVQTSLKNIRRVAFAPSPTGLRCLVIGDEGCAVIHPDLSVVERVRDRSHLHKIEDAAWLSDDRLLVSMDNGMIQTFTASLKPHTSPVSTVPISRSAASAARFGHKVLVRALLSAMHQPTKDEYTLPADASDHLARDDVYAKTRALLALLPPSTHRQLTAAPSIAHRCLAACHAFGDAWAASFWRLVLCTPPSHNAVGSSQEQQGGGLDLLSLEEGNATLQQSSGVTTADAAGSHNHGDEADGDGKDETKEQQHQQEQQDNEGEDDEEEDVHDSADTARQLPVEFGSLRSTSALRTRNRRSLHLYHDLHLQQPFGDGMRRLVVDKHVCLQQSDRAIQMLLQTDASKPNYYADALRACLIAATTNPATAVHTIKIAAMNLIAADRITEGVDLLVTIGHIRDACKYLQAYGRWAEAVDLAKTRLSTQAAHAVVEEYATHLCSHRQFGEAALHFVTTNNTDRAVECLRSMQQPHMAALFLLHRKHELDKTAAAADVSASSSSAPHDQQQQHHQHHQHHQQGSDGPSTPTPSTRTRTAVASAAHNSQTSPFSPTPAAFPIAPSPSSPSLSSAIPPADMVSPPTTTATATPTTTTTAASAGGGRLGSGSGGRMAMSAKKAAAAVAARREDEAFWFGMTFARWRAEGVVPRTTTSAPVPAGVVAPADMRARSLKGPSHKHRVRALCTFGAWGEAVASAGRDKTVRLWSVLSPNRHAHHQQYHRHVHDEQHHDPTASAATAWASTSTATGGADGGDVFGAAQGGGAFSPQSQTRSTHVRGRSASTSRRTSASRLLWGDAASDRMVLPPSSLSSLPSSLPASTSSRSSLLYNWPPPPLSSATVSVAATPTAATTPSPHSLHLSGRAAAAGGDDSDRLPYGSGECVYVYEHHRRSVASVVCAAWAERLLSCDAEEVHMWSPHTGHTEAVVSLQGAELHTMLPAPMHGVVFVGHSDAEVSAFDPRAKGFAFTWKVLPDSFAHERDAVTALALMHGGEHLCCGTYGGRVGVLDARMGEVVGGWAPREEQAAVHCLADCGGGRVLVASEHRCSVVTVADRHVSSVLPTGDHTATDVLVLAGGDAVAVNGSSKLYYMPGVCKAATTGAGNGGSGGLLGGMASQLPSVEVWKPAGLRNALPTCVTAALDGGVCVLGCDSGALRVVPAPSFCLQPSDDSE